MQMRESKFFPSPWRSLLSRATFEYICLAARQVCFFIGDYPKSTQTPCLGIFKITFYGHFKLQLYAFDLKLRFKHSQF